MSSDDSRTTTENSSPSNGISLLRTEIQQLKSQVWDLKSENGELSRKAERYRHQIENANYEGFWAKKYDILWNSQGSYEKGLRDGQENYGAHYESQKHKMEKGSGLTGKAHLKLS